MATKEITIHPQPPERPRRARLTDVLTYRQPRSREFTAERRQRIDAIKRELLAEMPLHELRRARTLTQQDLAETLQVSQPAVAKLEQRADVYVSSLRSYIEPVGRKLKIVAEFPEGEIAITNFSQIEDNEAP